MGIIEWATSPWGQTVPIHIAWFLIWVAAILGLLLLIPRRIGFATPGTGREPAFTDPVPYRQHLHMMDAFYTLLEPLGVAPAADLAPLFCPLPTHESASDPFLRAGRAAL